MPARLEIDFISFDTLIFIAVAGHLRRITRRFDRAASRYIFEFSAAFSFRYEYFRHFRYGQTGRFRR